MRIARIFSAVGQQEHETTRRESLTPQRSATTSSPEAIRPRFFGVRWEAQRHTVFLSAKTLARGKSAVVASLCRRSPTCGLPTHQWSGGPATAGSAFQFFSRLPVGLEQFDSVAQFCGLFVQLLRYCAFHLALH